MPLWVLGSKGGEEGIDAEEAAVFTLFESDQNDWIRTYEGQGHPAGAILIVFQIEEELLCIMRGTGI